MATLSDKYIAGFLDADGSIKPAFKKTTAGHAICYVSVAFAQRRDRVEVLRKIQESIGGTLSEDAKTNSFALRLYGTKAISALNRIKKHLVVKRHYCNVMLDMYGQKTLDVDKTKAYLKEQRKVRSVPLPNFPPRKWLAGYFDGDGCLYAVVGKRSVSATVKANIAASDYDSEGIEIIHKAYGGFIRPIRKDKPHVLQWNLSMPASKAKQFLGYFSKHLIVKKAQADFILGCADMGHFRDGERISHELKQLKAQPHRLSERDAVVIRDIETERERYRRLYHENGGCLECGTARRPYKCHGLCDYCYKHKRQSVGVRNSNPEILQNHSARRHYQYG